MGAGPNYGNLGAAAPAPAWAPDGLFGSGEGGFAYDFFDKSKLFQNTNGTTPVAADGDPIGYATDLSGNGNHATAPGNNNRPLYYGYADFDASDDRLLTPAITFPSTTTKMTLVYGVRKDASGFKMQMHAPAANSSSYGFWIYHDDNANCLEIGELSTSGGPILRIAGYTAPALNVVSVVFDVTGTTTQTEIKPRLDGVAATTIVTVESNLTSSAGFGFFQAAQTLTIGARNTGANALNGRMYRMILISRELTTEELETAEAWVQESFT